MAARDYSLEETMSILSDADLQSDLESLYDSSEDFRAHLEKLKPLQIAVLALNTKTISELKSYANPPVPVKDVMYATFLLLGYNESDLEKWRYVTALIGKKGVDSFKIQIATFDQSRIKPGNLKKARSILGKYRPEGVKAASLGAATFYQWAINTIQDIDGHQSIQTDQAKQD